MPSSDGKLHLLNDILKEGIEKLLNNTRDNGFLEQPYGRRPAPTPLMSEESFLKSGGLQLALQHLTINKVVEDKESDLLTHDESEFYFEYGYNPLIFLADYIMRSHPNSIKQRQEEKFKCHELLNKRICHAKKQLSTFEELKNIVDAMRSGILWGPYSSPISQSNDVMCILQPLREGKVKVQISSDVNYEDAIEIEHIVPSSIGLPAPIKFIVPTLQSDCKYYIRATLIQDNPHNVSDEVNSTEEAAIVPFKFNGDAYQSCTFFTAAEHIDKQPSSDAFQFSTVSIIGMGVANAAKCALSKSYNVNELLSCHKTRINEILMSTNTTNTASNIGDAKNDTNNIDNTANDDSLGIRTQSKVSMFGVSIGEFFLNQEDLQQAMWTVYSKSSSSKTGLPAVPGNPMLKEMSVMLAWNDTRGDSDIDLHNEEICYKEYSQELKKFHRKKTNKNKKEPVLERPKVSSSLSSFVDNYPVDIREGATRALYRSYALNEDIQVFALDARNSYLGVSQAQWLEKELLNCGSLWKIVITAVPLGVNISSSKYSVATAVSDTGNDDADVMDTIVDKVVDDTTTNVSSDELLKRVQLPSASVDLTNQPTLRDIIMSLQAESIKKANSGSTEDDADSYADESVDAKLSCPSDGSIVIESGIVFMSGGVCNTPFFASYDPNDLGQKYCVELGLGTINAGCLHDDVKPADDMKSTFFYFGQEPTVNSSGCSSITMSPDGALHVTIASTTGTSSGSEVTYEAVLRSGKMYLSN